MLVRAVRFTVSLLPSAMIPDVEGAQNGAQSANEGMRWEKASPRRPVLACLFFACSQASRSEFRGIRSVEDPHSARRCLWGSRGFLNLRLESVKQISKEGTLAYHRIHQAPPHGNNPGRRCYFALLRAEFRRLANVSQKESRSPAQDRAPLRAVKLLPRPQDQGSLRSYIERRTETPAARRSRRSLRQ
jgi:hypothetical protein